MSYRIVDLGIAGYGEANLDGGSLNLVRHPVTGEEFAVLPTLEHAFILIDPRTRSGKHIQPDMSVFQRTSRYTVQGPGGALYSIGFHRGQHYSNRTTGALLKWDWEGDVSRPLFDLEISHDTCVGMEFDTNGELWLLLDRRLSRLNLINRSQETVLEQVGQCVCGTDDQRLYFIRNGSVCALDTRTLAHTPVSLPDGRPCPVGRLYRDGAYRVIIPTPVGGRDGRTDWIELRDGLAQPVAADSVRLAETLVANVEAGQTEPFMMCRSSCVFADGSYISRVIGTEVTIVDAGGQWHTFTVERKIQPLQIFSMENGGGRLWLGTVLPLHLLSFEFGSGRFENHGIPSPASGEIYNMVWSGGRLFIAAYTGAYITRYDPNRPLRFDKSEQANPRQFGQIKDSGPALHRIHGKARDTAGNVFFAAKGDYGCVDSGICRIDIATEEMRRWIYPATTMTALAYLSQTDQLLVCERRRGEPDLRLTFIAPDSGALIDSQPLIADDGDITAWLHDGDDLVYGLHDYRATIFAYSLAARRIVARIEELAFGHHCKNSLIFGPDGRIWGQTHDCIFAVDRELKKKERLADYPDKMLIAHSRFGIEFGPDGHLYFMNGANLMRMEKI